MKSSTIILIAILLTTQHIFAQLSYSDYGEDQKKIVFSEDFEYNRKGWDITSTQYMTKGKLHIEDCDYTPDIKFRIKTKRNFEIETSIKVLEENSWLSKIMWGQKDDTHFFSYGFNTDYQYYICEYDGSEQCYKSKTTTKTIKNDEFNKLTIRKVGEMYYFFINEVLVDTQPFTPFHGNYLSLCASCYTQIDVDYLTVAYLSPKKEDENPMELEITSPVVNKDKPRQETQIKEVTVSGIVKDKDGIKEVTVNGVKAKVEEDGSFSAEIKLKKGKNIIEVKAKDNKDNEGQKSINIIRKTPKEPMA